jgi:hypothetical protein
LRKGDSKMNRSIGMLVVIGILLVFIFIQSTLLKEQRREILNAKNTLNLEYQEYDYYNSFEVTPELINLQDQYWDEMLDITKFDFKNVVERIQKGFTKHGWTITGVESVEEELLMEGDNDEVVKIDSNKLYTTSSQVYEIHFVAKDETILFPQDAFLEAIENLRVVSLKLNINDEETHGFLKIIYTLTEINDDSLLKL